MNKMYLSIALLYAINSATSANADYTLDRENRAINAPIISNLDGKLPMEMLIHFRARIAGFIDYNHTPNGTTVVKLHNLAMHEHACELKGADAELAKAQIYLKKLIENVSEITKTEPCFKYFHTMHSVLNQLVDEWAEQSEKLDGKFYRFIKSWKKLGTEHELLTNHIHSLQELEQFLNELHQFLGDLIVSFPKSLATYQNSHNEQAPQT